MKDFLKWLGANEKIAKIAVWMLIFMIFLIVINASLESLGFSYYKITAENLSKININTFLTVMLDCLLSMASFYAILFLVIRIKDYKYTIKYFVFYILAATFITNVFDYAICQIFIIVYIIGTCYIYGNKKIKYILYGICAFLINTGVQYVCYLYKARFIKFNVVGSLNKIITSLDYFIIMLLIIVMKEIYIKKRGEKLK